jgi:hypothetical protein
MGRALMETLLKHAGGAAPTAWFDMVAKLHRGLIQVRERKENKCPDVNPTAKKTPLSTRSEFLGAEVQSAEVQSAEVQSDDGLLDLSLPLPQALGGNGAATDLGQ